MRKFEEYNVFVQIGKMFSFWRRSVHRHRTGFCPQNQDGHHSTSWQIPYRTLARLIMILAALYLPLWLMDLAFGLLRSYLWGFVGFFFAGVSVILLLLLGFRLRIRYTLTESELHVRVWRQRQFNLKDLQQWNLSEPPRIKPGRKIRLAIDGTSYLTLRRFRTMEGGTHFVMLLSEATGLNLIEPFLGLEVSEKPQYTLTDQGS